MKLKNKIKEKIKEAFYINNGYIRTKDISSQGINRRYLRDLINEGVIERIKQGVGLPEARRNFFTKENYPQKVDTDEY